MLEALKQRDASAHWDATATMLPSESQSRGETASETPGAPTVSAQTPLSLEEDSSAVGQWRPNSRTAARRPIRESAVAHQDLPPIPDMYDPPPAAPSAEPSADGATDRATDDETGMDAGVRTIADTPDALRDIEAILPYYDYDPNPDDEPCLHLCPRPDGKPCEESPEGEYAPRCPEEVPLGTGPFVGRSLPPSVFAWKASNITYNPLYFQDVALERYGHAYHPLIQPAVSVGRFGTQLVTLPYHMTLDPPHKEMYPLGYYRPGECAPKLLYQPPLNAKAAAVTAGFYTGFGLILP